MLHAPNATGKQIGTLYYNRVWACRNTIGAFVLHARSVRGWSSGMHNVVCSRQFVHNVCHQCIQWSNAVKWCC